MSKRDSGLTQEQHAELDALARLPDDQIDTTDILETVDWSGAKRGVFYRDAKRRRPLSDDVQRLRRPKSDE